MVEERKPSPNSNESGDAGDQASEDFTPADKGGAADSPQEVGGRDGPDPTRYGDWEKNGRCIDF